MKKVSEKEQERLFKELGARIRKHRRSKKIVQEDMMAAGFTTRHYQRIESGEPFTIKTACRICKALNISLGELFKGL